MFSYYYFHVITFLCVVGAAPTAVFSTFTLVLPKISFLSFIFIGSPSMVVAIKTINLRSKTKIQRRIRKFYQTGKSKKAIVRVKKGQIIPIFETPKEEAVVTTIEGEPIKIKERKDILGRTKVKVEKTAVGAAPTTQRKVNTGK